MKKLDRLWVKVTYEVDISGLEIPDEVYEELVSAGSRTIEGARGKYPEASEWLSSNVSESDAFQWEYEIEDLVILNKKI